MPNEFEHITYHTAQALENLIEFLVADSFSFGVVGGG